MYVDHQSSPYIQCRSENAKLVRYFISQATNICTIQITYKTAPSFRQCVDLLFTSNCEKSHNLKFVKHFMRRFPTFSANSKWVVALKKSQSKQSYFPSLSLGHMIFDMKSKRDEHLWVNEKNHLLGVVPKTGEEQKTIKIFSNVKTIQNIYLKF